MELKQMHYFIETAEEKSFSKAAKNLYLTQQALSKAIFNLEKELGVPLFNRNPCGLELTEYGRLFYPRSKNIVKKVSDLEEEMDKLKNKLDTKITIAVSYGILSTISPNMLTQFRLSNPGIDLTVGDYPDLICEDMILNGKADIGCVVGPIQEHLFKCNLLFSEDLYLLVNKENELAAVNNITIEHLKYQDYLLGTDDFKISRTFKLLCKEHGFKPKINFVSNEMSLLEKLVSFNKGVALVPNHNITHMTYPNIRAKKMPRDFIDWKVYIIKKKDKASPKGVEVFWNYIIHNLNRYILDF